MSRMNVLMETTLINEKVKMELQNEKEKEETTGNNRNKRMEEWGGIHLMRAKNEDRLLWTAEEEEED